MDVNRDSELLNNRNNVRLDFFSVLPDILQDINDADYFATSLSFSVIDII